MYRFTPNINTFWQAVAEQWHTCYNTKGDEYLKQSLRKEGEEIAQG